ncbi:prepilin-type N-terminal cleavage/methylation domain-containing protein [Alteromonas hispanica]|uniref:Prepilin cleavage protein n=1 Tax=Alteromonas hispanica TaxID=315421 RepID=A0A6L9MY11_9ALTE|nr:prepilin-type N-terminal cleavage/methylation domain-containing protein [Alteromonas hispanica]NDW22895.1 prepilin cleavage protein [Alteromonas hispanica]
MLIAREQSGFSLVELLIGMALGITALSALSSLVGTGIGVNANLLSGARVNEEASNIMSLLVRDIKRAGYSGATTSMVQDPSNNPSPFADSIELSAHPGEAINSCILFSYDANNNGIFDAGADGDNFGYRLKNNTIEIRVNDAECDGAGWLPLTDPSTVVITALSFAVNQTVANEIPTTIVRINLQAEHANDENVSRQYTMQALVRNYDG